jgi:hypothetical protein
MTTAERSRLELAPATGPRAVPAWVADDAPPATDVWPHTKRPMPWVLAAFMAMIWVIPFDSVSLPVSLPLDAKLDRPLLIGAAGLWVLSLIGDRRRTVSRLRISPVHWAVLSLLILALGSLVLNDATIVRLSEMDIALRKLALLFSYALLFFIVASAIKPAEVRNFATFMVCLASITAIGALIEFRTGYNVFFQWMSHVLSVQRPGELGAVDSIGRKSVIGPTIHPLAVAMMMSLALPFALMGFLTSEKRKIKIRYALATALFLAAAVATQRKTSFIAPGVGLVVFLAYRPRSIVKLAPIAVLLLVVVHIAAPGALGAITQQLKPNNLTGVASTQDRQSDYPAIKPDIIQHPLLGRGWESYDQKKYRILDNQYLSLVIGVGILGVLSYLSIFLTIFLLAHRVARSHDPDLAPTAVACAASITSLVVGSALLDTLALAQLAYLICFIGGLVVVAAQAEAPARRRAAAAARPAVRMADVTMHPRWAAD